MAPTQAALSPVPATRIDLGSAVKVALAIGIALAVLIGAAASWRAHPDHQDQASEAAQFGD